MVLSQQLASGVLLETVGKLSGMWPALVPWPGDRGHTRAEVSGENVVLAQLVGLAALKDNSSKADPPEIGLCLRLKGPVPGTLASQGCCPSAAAAPRPPAFSQLCESDGGRSSDAALQQSPAV